MYYEINISKNGSHYFATSERSITSMRELKEILPVLLEKFPEDEGYEVSASWKQVSGAPIDVNQCLKEAL